MLSEVNVYSNLDESESHLVKKWKNFLKSLFKDSIARRNFFFNNFMPDFEIRGRVIVNLMNDKTLFPNAEEFLILALVRRELKILKFLQEVAKFNVHAFRFDGGMSALHYLLERGPHRSEYDARGMKTKEMVDYLLEDSLENYQDDHGFTYFHGACMTGNVSAVLRFISQGVDIALDTYEYPPLHIAVQFKNTEIIKILLENGASPNHQESSVQSTPLFWLAIPRCLCDHDCYSCEEKKPVGEIVDMLVKYGANIEARNAYGDSPLQIAVSRFKVELTRSLLKHGANLNSLDVNKLFVVNFREEELKSYPITSNVMKVMQLLQSHGYELNMRTRLSMIKYLIKVKNESILVGVHPENTSIRLQLELFVADLFTMDYCKLNLPYVPCRTIAKHMCDEELIRLCEETDEEKLERTILPMPKRRRLC
ncbi:hypothetical protein TKK_0005829 [Trichogramma kaykai]|uniref:SOCS box domain-containing protein n=1 Tax=Trichogramma kaykai TaxID=54128 RepID=A0ABD2XGT3_9HYME